MTGSPSAVQSQIAGAFERIGETAETAAGTGWRWFKGLRWTRKALVIFAAVTVLGALAPKHAPQHTVADDPAAAFRARVLENTKRFVISRAKDPSSVQFGAVWMPSDETVCGYFTGKNSFGAMAGAARFVREPGGTVYLIQSDSDNQNPWWRSCR